jgi:hypothetical protein
MKVITTTTEVQRMELSRMEIAVIEQLRSMSTDYHDNAIIVLQALARRFPRLAAANLRLVAGGAA